MLVKDLKVKNENELNNLINDLKAQLFLLRFQNSTGQADQTHKIQLVKKDIARTLTIMRQLNFSLKKAQMTKSFKFNDVIAKKTIKPANDVASPEELVEASAPHLQKKELLEPIKTEVTTVKTVKKAKLVKHKEVKKVTTKSKGAK